MFETICIHVYCGSYNMDQYSQLHIHYTRVILTVKSVSVSRFSISLILFPLCKSIYMYNTHSLPVYQVELALLCLYAWLVPQVAQLVRASV